uniref:Tf2-1-like SH3-like domain-containing protein n=1 Tax=Nicotiana tabacum TaxID=4097 RepID=A0A1S4CV32_TOBAC|nr:PREDICTED: uncharacterized protein LOC107822909 [Nicotiana tabacum]
MERVGEVAYRLALPYSLVGVHPVFHVFMLQKYHEDRSHVLDFSTVQLDENLTYEEEPMHGYSRSAADLTFARAYSQMRASHLRVLARIWMMDRGREASYSQSFGRFC